MVTGSVLLPVGNAVALGALAAASAAGAAHAAGASHAVPVPSCKHNNIPGESGRGFRAASGRGRFGVRPGVQLSTEAGQRGCSSASSQTSRWRRFQVFLIFVRQLKLSEIDMQQLP